VAVVALAVITTVSGCDGHDAPASQPPTAAATAPAAQHFLDTYVANDGRVRRIDEGDDTVSEAQSYGLLISVAVGDHERFDAIWAWTSANLRRTDGLLAWHWRDGTVIDHEPAVDADLLTAYALASAGRRFQRPELQREATRLAAAVLTHESLNTPTGPVLMSPWAKPTRTVNPSYLVPFVFDALAETTDDSTWAVAAATARDLLATLITPPTNLVPDWATLQDDGGALSPASSPTGRSPETGLDAWRTPVLLAADCDPRGRHLAARAWTFLQRQDPVSAVYQLDGEPAVTWSHPAALVGAAAAAHSAGDVTATERLLTAAADLNRRHPSYYGSAWLALGSLLLNTDLLGGCATDNSRGPTQGGILQTTWIRPDATPRPPQPAAGVPWT
jgi:endoglucanase